MEYFSTLIETKIDNLVNPDVKRSIAISGFETTSTGITTSFPFMSTCNITFTTGNKFYIEQAYTNTNWRIRPIKMIGMFKYQ
jgi:hypothetical protein